MALPLTWYNHLLTHAWEEFSAYTGQRQFQMLSCGKEPTKYLSGITLHRESGGGLAILFGSLKTA